MSDIKARNAGYDKLDKTLKKKIEKKAKRNKRLSTEEFLSCVSGHGSFVLRHTVLVFASGVIR